MELIKLIHDNIDQEHICKEGAQLRPAVLPHGGGNAH